MDEVILTEADGEGYAVPEISHVELVLDGLSDTVDQVERGVAGVEALTGAQEYLQASMQAAGMLSMRQVAGNEGFMSSVGGGIKKAYEYVVKMFKSLWDFFFKRDNKKKAEEAKEALVTCKTTWTEIKMGGKTEAQTDAMISSLKSSASSQELAVVSKALEEVSGKSHAEKQKVLTDAMKKFAAASAKSKKLLTWKIDRLKAAFKGIIETTDAMKAGMDDDVLKSMEGQCNILAAESKRVIAELDNHRELKDPDGALSLLTKMTADVDKVKGMMDHFAQQETEIKKIIADCEKVMNESGTGNNAESKKHVDTLRVALGGLQKIARFTVEIYDSLKSLDKTLHQVFGI